MGWDFDSTHNLLTGGVTKINKLLGSGRSNRRLMCYIIAAVVVLGLLFYHVAGRATMTPEQAIEKHNASD